MGTCGVDFVTSFCLSPSLSLVAACWIEVAELYQTLCDSAINFKSLPVALRKVMLTKFQDFDNYQLAKYNKDKAKNRKKREKKKGITRPQAATKDKDGDKQKEVTKSTPQVPT